MSYHHKVVIVIEPLRKSNTSAHNAQHQVQKAAKKNMCQA